MHLIDTHTHLYSESFDEDRSQMINRAIASGVKEFVLPAIDSTYTHAMYSLKNEFPDQMHLMTGLHPTHVKPDSIDYELDFLKKQLDLHKFVAIGEIGVDLYWDQSTRDLQMKTFQKQIQLAKSFDLPIAIHCRNAFDEVFEILENEKGEELRGVFHCFTGNLEQAKKAIGYNMKLGIGGVLTFKNGKIDTFLNQIPIKHIVLETDAPYLAPVPFRGKRNESCYLLNVAEKAAQVYALPTEEIARITTQNAKDIFSLN